MKISVIHPSRNRPERANKVFQAMISTADKRDQLQYIISIDTDETKDYTNIGNDILTPITLISDNRYCVGAINNGAKASDGDILMVVSDDFDEWKQGWDTLVRDAFVLDRPMLLKTFDGAQKWIATLPIMNRKLYNKLGYIYNPEYLHMFVDTDLSCVCDLLGVTVYRNDILFRHNHYTKMKNKDATNERNDATWKQGEEMFLNRWKNFFGVDASEMKGQIKDERIKSWVKTKI